MSQGFTSGIPIDTDGTLSADSNGLVSSQKAVKTYVDTQVATKQPLDTQLTSLAGLSYAANALKVVRVNAGETDFELATPSGGSFDANKTMAYVAAY